MTAWAARGLQCVCVNADWPERELEEGGVYRAPMQNEVLTICEVRDDGYLRFNEIPIRQGAGVSVSWAIEAFRPLITHTQEQDLEHFLPLLNTVEEPA